MTKKVVTAAVRSKKTVAAGTCPKFPVVAIGASAGGLEALDIFLRSVPVNSGMAFVVVQHLDPNRQGLLPELLQRATPMPVKQVTDRLKVLPDHVYVIPPNRDMSLLNGMLHLLEPSGAHGLRLPIDFFFKSVAQDQQERSIGVILSGMGSDGTHGLQEIKENAGVVFVQSPESAKFDGMPRSAIEAGLADVVAPAEELPAKIIAYEQHTPLLAPNDASKARGWVEKVALILRAQTGHDFSLYKQNTMSRRIERRMGIHLIKELSDYVKFLRENPQEGKLLFKELLIGVTSFFRDPQIWDKLKNEIIPELISGRAPEKTLRAWVPGCASGEEAYSLAIVFKEAVEAMKTVRGCRLQIFATDLDADAIDKARSGMFNESIAADVSPERLERFFVKTDSGYQIAKAIREMVIFAPQNCIMDPPFTKLDLLSCRNLLIYLAPELQRKLMPLFHYSINPGGCLLLGNSESIGNFTHLFRAIDGKARLYRRHEASLDERPVDFPSAFSAARDSSKTAQSAGTGGGNLQELAEVLLLQRFSPPAVLTNDKGDIVYINGRTGRFLEPAAGKANWSIFAMAREGLRYEMVGAFQKAVRSGQPVVVKNLVVGGDGENHAVDIEVMPVSEPEALRGLFLMIFTDAPPPAVATASRPGRRASAPSARAAELTKEIEQLRHEIQSSREEMQTSQEELRSTNEELQSTNEELQSTNEELTTSKEEMQSLNEELQTVNQELQAKVEELSETSNDMKNLLDSTDIAILFLDSALKIRRFTPQVAKIFKLIPGDVGRPITDVNMDLDYPGFTDDVREVLRTLIFRENPIPTRDNRWFLIRIMPYRTLENVIDGVVITCSDITVAKQLESKLRKNARNS
ncbi:MAG: chemotaxis protein CheB [Candidatus Riflebacteria bacterium HGW-Riflebacteria-1]|jgi:two-component system CheB/CheR fusion protein|nr:MAG: chemotaxis protein CheB [Candidatus Riflebacteria bacterium HGW-Riflebacteria-1]